MKLLHDPEIYDLKEKRSINSCYNDKIMRLSVMALHLVRRRIQNWKRSLPSFMGNLCNTCHGQKKKKKKHLVGETSPWDF